MQLYHFLLKANPDLPTEVGEVSSISLFPFYTSGLNGQFVLVNGAYQPNIMMEVNMWHSLGSTVHGMGWGHGRNFLPLLCLYWATCLCQSGKGSDLAEPGHRQTAKQRLPAAMASQC